MRQAFSPAKCAVLKFTAQIFRMQQSELVPHIHPFAAACGADSSSSDLHSGKSNFRARFLPSHRFLCNDWLSPRRLTPLWNGLVRTAPVEWFSLFSCTEACPAASLGYCTSDRVFHISYKEAPRASSLLYTTGCKDASAFCAAANLLQDSEIPTCASAHKPRSCFLNAGAASSNVAQLFRYWRGVAPSWVRKV